MQVICKLFCQRIEWGYLDHESKKPIVTVKFCPVKGEPFGSATPSGDVILTMVEDVAREFTIGQKYLVTFEVVTGG